jgi:uncharacterized OB-fold protein
MDTPFAYVRVRLDGADTDLLHIAREELAVGTRVHAVWAKERTGTIRDISHFSAAKVAQESSTEVSPASSTAAAPESPTGAAAEPVTAVRTKLSLPFRLAAGSLQTRFHEAVKRGELYGTRCEVCKQLYVPPREVCAKCWARCHGWERVSDEGKLNTFVVVNVPFYGQEITIPYILGHIQVDGADTFFFHLVGGKNAEGKLCMPSGVSIGARVRAVWRPAALRTGLINDDIDYFALDKP